MKIKFLEDPENFPKNFSKNVLESPLVDLFVHYYSYDNSCWFLEFKITDVDALLHIYKCLDNICIIISENVAESPSFIMSYYEIKKNNASRNWNTVGCS